MKPEFWLNSWEEGGTKTSFHRNAMHPYAITYAPPGFLKGKRVLVPLCGKDNTLMWFREHAEHVTGIELSEKAIQQFFASQELPYSKTANLRYEAERLTIINQDIFNLKPDDLGCIDFVYDRAALVALPEDMRQRYRQKIDEFMHIGSQCLVITLEYSPSLGETPPFSITPDEIKSYYQHNYAIDHVEKPELPEHRMVIKFGLNFLKEHGFMLTKIRDGSTFKSNLESNTLDKNGRLFLKNWEKFMERILTFTTR